MKSAKSILSIFPSRKTCNLIVIFSFLLASCNAPQSDNKPPAAGDSTTQAGIDTTTKVGNDTTQIKAAQAAAPAATLSGSLYVLRLSRDQYRILSRGDADNHKIVFKFYYADTIPNSPILAAFASRARNQFIARIPPQRLTLFTPLKSTLNLDTVKDKYLGDQEVLVSDIDTFINQLHIPATTNYNLLFTPNKENESNGLPPPHEIITNNVIYYDISVEGIVTATPTLRTNPSPPRSIK